MMLNRDAAGMNYTRRFFSVASYHRNLEEKGGHMSKNTIKIRLMEYEDFKDVVRIDEQVLQVSRREYYEQKFELLFKSGEYLPTSFVAQDENENIVGFIMGKLYIGEYGISREGAAVDAVGVNPDYQRHGIGKKLMDGFIYHLRQLGVKKINTLVDKNDTRMMLYFDANQFSPSKAVINLERSI
jgi:ribosomal protein S18 acetylase RimI-like enzyme